MQKIVQKHHFECGCKTQQCDLLALFFGCIDKVQNRYSVNECFRQYPRRGQIINGVWKRDGGIVSKIAIETSQVFGFQSQICSL